VSDEVSNPYKITGKIIVLYILIFVLLDSKLCDHKTLAKLCPDVKTRFIVLKRRQIIKPYTLPALRIKTLTLNTWKIMNTVIITKKQEDIGSADRFFFPYGSTAHRGPRPPSFSRFRDHTL
jgi:hypothetical protein